MMLTLSRAKAGLGIALVALMVAMPSSAASVTEAETIAMPSIAFELIDAMTCTVFTDAGGDTAVDCDAIAEAIADSIAAACEAHGGALGDFEMVTCFYLGAGYYYVRVEASCVY